MDRFLKVINIAFSFNPYLVGWLKYQINPHKLNRQQFINEIYRENTTFKLIISVFDWLLKARFFEETLNATKNVK